MPRVLIWDLPTRIFHWLLTIGFLISAVISVTADDDSPLFSAHMILGIVLGVMVLLRIVWGFVGTRHARFTSFLFSPLSLMRYVFGTLNASEPRSIGHNAGSSYAIFAMLGLVLATAGTGLMISAGNEAAEDLHGIVSYSLMAVVAVHIVGVVWYSLRHRENITLSMLTGRKEASTERNSIKPPDPRNCLPVVCQFSDNTTVPELRPDNREDNVPRTWNQDSSWRIRGRRRWRR